ncbi:septum formation family protein [Dactylosporangium sp. NPDC006015]|uniref:septum formation family protein n=1 Tax=Dactylosporangium sp. NPDC006015 TaxID=3154576 RepID=UPI0033AE782D
MVQRWRQVLARRWRHVVMFGLPLAAVLLSLVVKPAAEPAPPRGGPDPAVGACWQGHGLHVVLTAEATPTESVACEVPHQLETVAVGHVPKALARRDAPPQRAELTGEFAGCGRTAGEYLGADWRTLDVSLLLFAPTAEQWQAGARWYRCDVVALGGDIDSVRDREGSVHGDPAGHGPSNDLTLNCAVRFVADDEWAGTKRTPCTEPHDMEFAGVAESAAPAFPETAAARDAAFGDQCRDRALAYTAMPGDLMRGRAVTVGFLPTGEPSTWPGGDHYGRCWVFLPHPVTVSIRGAGDLPA